MRRRSPRRAVTPVAIKEFENLDRNLAAVVEPVAQLRGAELSVWRSGGERRKQMRDLGNSPAQEEMVRRDFIQLTHAGELLEQSPHLLLWKRERGGNVAHPRRTEAFCAGEQRCYSRECASGPAV